MNHLLKILALTSLLFACNRNKQDVKFSAESINLDELKTRIATLASDDFQGRFPATMGEEKTIKYLEEQFRLIGTKPGNGDSFLQSVPLIEITSDQAMKLTLVNGKENIALNFFDDFIGGTPQPVEKISISNADLVFVGYGINAPEFNWNDYDGIDVKGKIVMAFVNDPGFYDSTLFKGKNMTYYGRWIYKYEEAARQGAAGVVLIHETEAASYPWAVVQNSWAGTRFYLADNIVTKSGLQLQSWVTNDAARKIFKIARMDYDQQLKAASNRGFRSVDLKLKTSIAFKNKVKNTVSNNVVALIPGSDLANEYLIYTAHWDHFGINSKFKGDSILNGALDNATGTAALIQLAESFNKLQLKPRRSIVFIAVTCEEQGLLGSQYYAENPIYPLNKTVAVINLDVLNIFGKTKDMTIAGFGYSELDDYAIEVLKSHGRYAAPAANPQSGGYYRSDHFSFSKVGVPSLNMSSGIDNIEHGKKWMLETFGKWGAENYHKPSDNFDPNVWKFDGMTEDLAVYLELGYKFSNTDKFPNWREGVLYKPKRDEMMK